MPLVLYCVLFPRDPDTYMILSSSPCDSLSSITGSSAEAVFFLKFTFALLKYNLSNIQTYTDIHTTHWVCVFHFLITLSYLLYKYIYIYSWLYKIWRHLSYLAKDTPSSIVSGKHWPSVSGRNTHMMPPTTVNIP